MKALLFTLACALLGMGLSPAHAASISSPEQAKPKVPDTIGFAGMAAAHQESKEKAPQTIIYAGGANFPQAQPNAQTPEQRGPKVFSDQVGIIASQSAYLYERSNTEELKSQWVGKLPYKVGYAAYATAPKGIIIAGGCNEEGHLNKVTQVIYEDGKVVVNDKLPQLPHPVAYPAFALVGSKFYVIGGQQNASDTSALAKAYVFDFNSLDATKVKEDKNIKQGWQALPDMPIGRMLAAAAVHDGRIYVMGGCSLAPDAQGNAQRTYLKDVLVFDPQSAQWKQGEAPDMPVTMAASPTPLPVISGKAYVFGGDTGDYYRASLAGNAPATHPGQSNKIYSYDFDEKTWSETGNYTQGVATAPIVNIANSALIISGETHPGVRTPAVQIQVFTEYPTIRGIFNALAKVQAYTPWAAGLLLLVLIGLILKNGLAKKKLAKYDGGKPGKWAWICVGILWVVVMLNYADRGLVSVLTKSITADVIDTNTGMPIDAMQLGIISAAFLIVYAVLSPVGGYLADRYSRKAIIMGSLIIWSVVTWATGMAETYNELLVARLAMGISEAFYIPAALALITDYHRGSTRSLATGLHMSGIYAGQAIAGYGAVVSGDYGWHLTFEMFGFIGVLYALVVIIFLRDPKGADEESPEAASSSCACSQAPAAEEEKQFGVGEVLRSLFATKAMYILLAVWTLTSFANWFILSWYPRLLSDSFGISEAEAGPMATGPISIVKYVAVLLAAVLADSWARSNPNARARVPAIAFMIAGPCVVIAMLPSFGVPITIGLSMAVALVCSQGLAQGAIDANLMPILRSQIDERFAATGYGILNFASAGAGALITIYGGMALKQNMPLGPVLGISGAVLCVVSLCLFSLKAKKA